MKAKELTNEQLKLIRISGNYTQEQFAKILGIQKNTLARKEGGDRPVTRQDEIIATKLRYDDDKNK